MLDVEHRTFIPADGREVRASLVEGNANERGVMAREVVFHTVTGEEVGRAPLRVEKPLWGLNTEELQAHYLTATGGDGASHAGG